MGTLKTLRSLATRGLWFLTIENFGAGGGSRTRTTFRSTNFKSQDGCSGLFT